MLTGSQASLQLNCNGEGFTDAECTTNGVTKARIDFLGDIEYDCVTCHSTGSDLVQEDGMEINRMTPMRGVMSIRKW